MRLKQVPLKYLIPVFYFVAIVLMVIFQWSIQYNIRSGSGSPIYRNLMEQPASIRRGFDPAQIMTIPVVSENNEWFSFDSPPLTVRNSNLPDLPNRTYLSPFGKPAEEFTIIIPIEMDDEAISMMENNAAIVPGFYFSIISENWEIYLNGNLIRSELHLDENGQIKSNRTWRDVHFPADKNMFVPGTNVLALRIIGDPSYNVTGLYYAEPHYMDDYKIIQRLHQSYLRYFVCGVLGYTGIYYLLIFISIRSKKEIYNLYYGIFSLFLCVHFIATEGTVNMMILNSDISARIEYFTFFIAITMLLIFIEYMGKQRISKISWGFLAFSLFIGISHLFFCNQYADEVMHLYLVLMLVYFTYVFFDIIKSSFTKRSNDNKKNVSSFLSILIGSLVVYACGIHDALDVIIFRNAFRLFLYSTFVFHVGMAITMSRRFSKVFIQLEHSNIVLENTVHERTLELEKQTMIAVQASKAKSQFLATMSHEIRTPLNAVIGLSEIELQGDLPEKSKNNIDQIYQSGSSLLGIINDILDISKIEAGSFNLIPVEYETAGLINDTINLNRVRIGSKPLNLILEIDGDFPRKLFGDDRRLKQVLNNILSNAIKYTKEGSITLAVKCENNTRSGRVLLSFIVQDTGIGIRQDDIERMFKDYTQLDIRANQRIEGTGLGLAITKKLSEMMGGNISVESDYGKGSKFTINIYQTLVNDDTIGKETAEKLCNFQYAGSEKERQIDRSWMPYGKVLVVDDMPVNLRVAQGLLSPYGLKVDIAISGHEALEKLLSNNVYDIVFMDHMMPEMDGIETTNAIRKYEINVPVIALTANALVGNMEMFLANGFNGYISKPIDIVLLDDILNKWIRNKQSAEVLKNAAEEYKNIVKTKAAEKPDDTVRIPEIQGINVEFGISATGGTIDGYRRVLYSFYRDAQERLKFLEEYLNLDISHRENSSFIIHVHALKSALASIGAKEASDQAAALETAGKCGDQIYINNNLYVFINLLSELAGNVQQEIGSQSENNQTSEIDKGMINEYLPLFNELIELIKSKAASSKIDTIIDELKSKHFDSQTNNALDKTSDDVLVAEYDSALQTIEKLLE